MLNAFESGGALMWPLALIAVGIIVLAGRTAWLLRRGSSREAEGTLQAILFWGVIGAVLGFLGTIVGIVQITRVVSLAGSVEAPLVWGGFGVALVTLIFGLLILLVAALLWFVLRMSRNRTHATSHG